MVVPGVSKEVRCVVRSQMWTSPVSAREAACEVCGEARMRLVVVGRGRERDSRMGSSSVSDSSSSSSSSSSGLAGGVSIHE